jgi:hypothetical protein
VICPVCEVYELRLKAGQLVAPGPASFVCPWDGFEVVRMFHGDPGVPRKP